ncbi:hypothetical protein [Nocardia australiensis]|nr:hypothetical protein [Nocardia australiensis]
MGSPVRSGRLWIYAGIVVDRFVIVVAATSVTILRAIQVCQAVALA